jgi:hypothetical protein
VYHEQRRSRRFNFNSYRDIPLRRLLALTEPKFSNSTIEAWWRSLKHQWLFLHSLDSVATVHRLVAFYVDAHNRVLPHSAFRGQTPDEMSSAPGTRSRRT